MHRHVFDHTLALVGATGGRTAVHRFLRPAPPKRGTVVWRVVSAEEELVDTATTGKEHLSPPVVSPGGEEVWCRIVELRGCAVLVS